jgi:pyridinium-3,5-biscarboxylic acid mononucleotide synthase
VSGREIVLDWARRDRLGFEEAILCLNKSARQIAMILAEADANGRSLLLTRLTPERHAALAEDDRARLDYREDSQTAFFGHPAPPQAAARIAVASAGTSDVGVAREAVRTLSYHGHACLEIYDIGVAGLWRLLERVEELRNHAVVICVAGMDAALPSVLGGLLPGLIIAVPTSTGYGVSDRGRTALHASLASCAPGIVVVNIDNGYGAACAAIRVMKRVCKADPYS